MSLEPITRAEQIMSGKSLTPITREEMFLAKAGGQQVGDLKPITRKEMFLSKIGGGGAEIKTCNVRFKSFSAEAGEYAIFAIEHPYFYGDACYSTYENGEIVSKEIEIEHLDDEFDITLENVVCGSLIYFNQDGGIIETDEAYDGKNHTKFETLFIAPTVPNVTAVFKCGLEGEIEW